MGTAPKADTTAGNLKSPGYAPIVEWIAEAWGELDSNLLLVRLSIVKSLSTIWLIMVDNFDILFEQVSLSMI